MGIVEKCLGLVSTDCSPLLAVYSHTEADKCASVTILFEELLSDRQERNKLRVQRFAELRLSWVSLLGSSPVWVPDSNIARDKRCEVSNHSSSTSRKGVARKS